MDDTAQHHQLLRAAAPARAAAQCQGVRSRRDVVRARSMPNTAKPKECVCGVPVLCPRVPVMDQREPMETNEQRRAKSPTYNTSAYLRIPLDDAREARAPARCDPRSAKGSDRSSPGGRATAPRVVLIRSGVLRPTTSCRSCGSAASVSAGLISPGRLGDRVAFSISSPHTRCNNGKSASSKGPARRLDFAWIRAREPDPSRQRRDVWYRSTDRRKG